LKELVRIMSAKLKLQPLIRHEKGLFSVDAVYHYLDQKIARYIRRFSERIDGVYLYEDGAKSSFIEAKAKGIRCLYDLPIGYWRSMHHLLAEEAGKRPDWASTITGFNDSKGKLERKDAEIQLADHIFAASSFTQQTLGKYPGKLPPVTVIPYGFPPVYRERTYAPLSNRKLKVLFVGGLSQRKGIANLFEAVSGLEDLLELTVVGRKAVEDNEALNTCLGRHTWIPALPHNEVLELMRSHDLFVFPSLFEGFGLVITEAMSQGTPVITTNRTAGPDIIEHDVNGWLVPAGNSEALREQLVKLARQPEKIKAAGMAAMQTAAQRPWSSYAKELARAIASL
jgi:glycosyltransferase involved in cell wall biosynthesis